ncbi:hypothetical protein WMY93_006956 [Mugilogobius chulae]|uniref:Uncharacterized protein n=1 Tax=Mugilogobius chulae TaxID=88201 RepID=A0AAW0PNV1_9GOBI
MTFAAFSFIILEHPTSQKLPDDKVTPPSPALPKPTTKAKNSVQDIIVSTTLKPSAKGSDLTGIIIVVVLIIIALLAGLVCYVARSRGRRYSVDLTSRPDEAQIPLSTVEPEGLVETVTSNGLQFEGTENRIEDTPEPEVKTEEQVEQKAESEKQTVDPSADSATPAADKPEDQPNPDNPEQSCAPKEPAKPSTENKTDDEEGEGDASNKTSVESLKEINEDNENNSNSSLLPHRGAREGEVFWNGNTV